MRRIDTLSQALGQEEEAEINLTPMLDVVFIMLIFFIVTASFIKEFGVDASRPPVQETPPDSDAKSIAVKISSSGNITIDGLNIDPRAVSAFITRKRAEAPDAGIAVLAGKGARTELVVGVIDSARAAGFTSEPIPVSELAE